MIPSYILSRLSPNQLRIRLLLLLGWADGGNGGSEGHGIPPSLQNVFSYDRMCSLTIECVPFSYRWSWWRKWWGRGPWNSQASAAPCTSRQLCSRRPKPLSFRFSLFFFGVFFFLHTSSARYCRRKKKDTSSARYGRSLSLSGFFVLFFFSALSWPPPLLILPPLPCKEIRYFF